VLQTDRICVDWQTVQRGTLQHEIFEGGSAVAFVDGAKVIVKVNCVLTLDVSMIEFPMRSPLHWRQPTNFACLFTRKWQSAFIYRPKFVLTECYRSTS